MSSTRSVISPGVFANDANTTIPPTPIQGVSYRDTAAASATVDGWPYFESVNSAEFNQIMFQYSTLLSIIDKKGVLGWSDLVDYTEAAIVFGSDGNLYTRLLTSGPNNGGAKDPISEPTYWSNATFGIASTAQAQALTNDSTAISPLKLAQAFQGANQSLASSGYQKLPGGLILQWGTSASIAVNTNATITLPVTFPNAGLNAHATMINSDSSLTKDNAANVVSLSTNQIVVRANEVNTNNTSAPYFWFALGW